MSVLLNVLLCFVYNHYIKTKFAYNNTYYSYAIIIWVLLQVIIITKIIRKIDIFCFLLFQFCY